MRRSLPAVRRLVVGVLPVSAPPIRSTRDGLLARFDAAPPAPASSGGRWIAAAVAITLLLVAAPARAQETAPAVQDGPSSGDAVLARIAELGSRLDSRIRDPGAAADLYELYELAGVASQLERLADVFVRVAWNGKAHQEVRALAFLFLADVERRRGRIPKMEANLAQIGAITDVAFVGPFDNENKGGFDVAYGPEKQLDLSRAYDGLRSEVRWRRVAGLGLDGRLRFDEAVRPSRDAVVYALVVLEVHQDRQAVLRMGASGATRTWLNGKPVQVDATYHPARFDQLAFPVQLKKGENVLLVKLAGGSSGPLGLFLRVVDADGDPVKGLKVLSPTDGSWPAPQPAAAPSPKHRQPAVQKLLLAELKRLADSPGASPRTLHDYARVLGARRSYDDTERLHVTAAIRAAAAAPADVDAQLLAAEFENDDLNQRRGHLEAAVRAERPGEARAHAALAQFWLERGYPRRALELLEKRTPQAPTDWSARMLRVRALDAVGLSGRADAELNELAVRFRNQPAILREVASYRRRSGQGDAAVAALRVAVALHPADREGSSALASILLERGAVEDAAMVLEQAIRFEPTDIHLLGRLADVLANNGRGAEARRIYERAAAICPQEGELFERMGRAALRAGDVPGALAAFESAVRIQPQNANLRDLMRALKPGERAFAKPFLHDLRVEVAAAAGKWEGEDAANLVDLTATRVLPSGQSSRTTQTIRKLQSQRAVDEARFSVRYAPDREQVKIERARVLKADGTIVDSHAEDDRNLNEPWAGLYYDARARVIAFPGLAPGDTVELVYRVDDVGRDNLLSDYFGDLTFVQGVHPTASWEYVLEMPAGRKLYFNQVAGLEHAETTTEAGGALHRWSGKDIAKIVAEPEMPGWSEVASYLHVSTYRDWESVARFWWGLIKDQIVPTPTIEKLAKEIVAGISELDVAGRVRAVYDYVVTNTRYVGLEFGIHSFKPYKVETILSRKFGDCKDKASLTYSLLRSLGIESRLVLLRMRDLGKVGGEPASLAVFNHAILYVPPLDLWLDGTAEWSGSRELPQVDRGAEVLVVDPGGTSVFQVTPEARAEHAVSSSSYEITLDERGGAELEGESVISGLNAPSYRRAYASPNARKAAFEQAWARSFPGLTVSRLEVSDVTRIEEEVRLAYVLRVPRYAEPVPTGLAFTPFGTGATYVESYAPLSTRRFDFVLDYPWVNRFRYEYVLPAGFAPSQLPPAVSESTPFGTVELEYRVEADRVIAEGSVSLRVPRVTPAEYPAFRAFLGRVDSALARKVILGRASASR